jgi:hypothetical protein
MAAVSAIPTGVTAVTDAADHLPRAKISWYVGAHHDLHAQQPDRCAADLQELAARLDNSELDMPSSDREMTQ